MTFTRWINRQRYLIDFTAASMWRHKWRNVLLLAVYAFTIFLLASVLLYGAALRHAATSALKDAPEVTVQRIVMGRHALAPADWPEKLKGIRGARKVEGRLWGYFYDRANGANYTLMVPSRFSQYADLAPGEAVVGAGIKSLRKDARNLNWLNLLSPSGKLFRLKIRKVLPAGSELVSADLVLLSRADFLRFFSLPQDAGYTDVALSVRNRNEVDTIVNKISRLLPDARVISRKDILRTYENIFSWREGIVLAMLASALAAFAIFAFDKASGLSAEERREIGILKALGWDTSDILSMKLWEGALISAGAFLLGVVAAWLHIFLFDAGLLAPVLKGWAVLYPKVHLAPRLDGLQLLALAFMTIVPFTAATLVPVWKAAIADPDTVMR